MAKWDEYGLKSGTSAEDEVLILDSDTNTNKRITVGDIQEFANGKMLEKENTTLNTEAKTLIGAVNEVDAKNDAQDESLEAIEKKFSDYVKKTDVDSTLSVSGSPADSKVVGDALKKDKEAIAELADKKITKFYASNQGDTHLPDSDKGKIQDMYLYGKSEQVQYKGKNLIQGREVNSTLNGITCKHNGDGTYTVNGTAVADTFFIIYGNFAGLYGSASSLKLVGCPSGGGAQKYFIRGYRKDGNPANSDEYGSGIAISSFEETGSNIAIIVRSGVTVNNLIFKPMLTTDTTATYADYEPYVGGIPSPSPDYPQEIKAVVNPKVVVSGKNLLNMNWIEIGSLADKYGFEVAYLNRVRIRKDRRLKVVKGERYTVSADTLEDCSMYAYVDGTYKESSSDYTFYAMPHTFEIKEDCEIAFVFRMNDNSNLKISEIGNIQIQGGSIATPYEPYTEQSIQLPITLYAIPVSSGGNVTIGNQQYVADYVDLEREKLVRMCKEIDFAKVSPNAYDNVLTISKEARYNYATLGLKPISTPVTESYGSGYVTSVHLLGKQTWNYDVIGIMAHGQGATQHQISIRIPLNKDAIEYFTEIGGCKGIFQIATPEEIDLTPEQVQAFKALSTNYPVTNIEVSSDQLDGYTVFNYPISMAEGWNYVKQQIGDTRDYIYDMDIQSAEAYVNSEYAVALAELEVM